MYERTISPLDIKDHALFEYVSSCVQEEELDPVGLELGGTDYIDNIVLNLKRKLNEKIMNMFKDHPNEVLTPVFDQIVCTKDPRLNKSILSQRVAIYKCELLVVCQGDPVKPVDYNVILGLNDNTKMHK